MLDLEKRLKSSDVFVRPTSKADWGGSLSMYGIAVTPVKNGKRRSLLLVKDPETDSDKRELSDKSRIFFVRDTGDGGSEIEAELASGKRVRRVIADCIRAEIAALIHVGLEVALQGKAIDKPVKLPNGKVMPAGSIQFTPAGGKTPLFFKPEFVLKLPMNSEADVDHNVAVFKHGTQESRHQWPVVGGDDFNMDTNRGLGFVGYLQRCLSASSFT